MLNKLIISILIATLGFNVAQAKSGPKEKKGLASGIIIGAIAGGPVGALAGMVFGTVTGKHLDEKKLQREKISALEKKVQTTQQHLLSQRQQTQQAIEFEKAHRAFAQQIGTDLSIDVLFRTNSVTLEPQGHSKMAPIASLLKAFPELTVHLKGYADSRGTDINNLALSNERAETVKKALVAMGIKDNRIEIEGFGERFASATDSDTEGNALDRHVAISFSTLDQEQNMASR